MKPVPKSLKTETKCENCGGGFRPEKNDKGRKLCYGCDPTGEGKVIASAPQKEEVLYEDRADRAEADIKILQEKVESLTGRIETLEKEFKAETKIEKKPSKETKKETK